MERKLETAAVVAAATFSFGAMLDADTAQASDISSLEQSNKIELFMQEGSPVEQAWKSLSTIELQSTPEPTPITVKEIEGSYVQEQIVVEAESLFSYLQERSDISVNDNQAALNSISTSLDMRDYISEEGWKGLDTESAKDVFAPQIFMTLSPNRSLLLTSITQNKETVTRESDGTVYPAGSLFFVFAKSENQAEVIGIPKPEDSTLGFLATESGKTLLTQITHDENGYVFKDVLIQDQTGDLTFDQLARHLPGSKSATLPTIEFGASEIKEGFQKTLIEKYGTSFKKFDGQFTVLDKDMLGNFKEGIQFVSKDKNYQIMTDIDGLDFEGINIVNFEETFSHLGLRSLGEKNVHIQIISNPEGAWLPAGKYVNESPITVDNSGRPYFLYENNPEVDKDSDTVTIKVHVQPAFLELFDQTAMMRDGYTRTRYDFIFDKLVLGALIATNPKTTSAYNQAVRLAPSYPDIFDIDYSA